MMFPTQPRLPVSYGPARPACNPAALVLLLVLLLAVGWARAAEPPRIVVIGDSLIHGYGLAQGEGLVPQLDRWLAEHAAPPAALVNMGVSGDTTAGGLARLDWALADGADAVILELGANDMLRGTDPAETRANLDAMLAELDRRGLPVLLIGMRAAANYGPDYQAAFDAIYPDLAAAHDALLYPFFFEGIEGEASMFQEDGLHPSAAGIAVVADRLGPLVLQLIDRVRR
jgi:acyl-CoA thioesterase-1